MANSDERIIALIDMDCFFCQVDARQQPELKGKPIIVTQFNLILAVNYEARALGVSRFGRGTDAKEKYPELNVISVPVQRGKGDVSKYRAAGQEIIEILKNHCSIIERASVDEAYLDITDLVDERMDQMNCSSKNIIPLLNNTYVVGYCDEDNNDEKRCEGLNNWIVETFDELGDIQARRLAVAGIIIEELRNEIFKKSEFKCSAGISYNKVLAKLACGLHKPNKQTILPAKSVPMLFSSLPINKLRNLGGKIGKAVTENLKCNVMSDLLRFSLDDLQKYFDDKMGLWLYNIARGIDDEPVISRLISKSIGASKNFPGKQAIIDIDVLKQWVDTLATDVSNRLQQDMEANNRRATTITISYQFYRANKTISQSRTLPLASYKAERIINQTLDIVKLLDKPIVALSIATSKFVPIENNGNFINYFKINTMKQDEEAEEEETEVKIEKEADYYTDSKIDVDVNNIEEIENIPLKETNINCDNAIAIEKKNPLAQLQEIFPNLDEIDLSIVQLLPLDLQREAKNYIKSKKNILNVSPSVKNNSKTISPKTKSIKSKSLDKNPKNTIQNFLIKTNEDVSSMVRCVHCSQMIKIEKYLEHTDFHVAYDLQKNINQSINNAAESSSKRTREKTTTPKSNKKMKGIESYFPKK
ncbi:hypothetical protein PV328_006742 [Microctonus aethiopoides]|uniref:DNA polymerase eta n=1 Tax=Microctonus aethiopoides TaxID=144406 RepID=A0AA39FQA8_9HYME|nr:hypothetical protein PV328_006742 [Microctonus aethiopoides]